MVQMLCMCQEIYFYRKYAAIFYISFLWFGQGLSLASLKGSEVLPIRNKEV